MSRSIKKFCLVICVSCTMFVFNGCTSAEPYHDGCGKQWIQEQVAKGNLTQEQANKLLKQEQE